MPSPLPTPAADSLALYKLYPARVLSVGEKIEIQLPSGEVKRVRSKDLQWLHSGPLRHLDDLQKIPAGEPEVAWEMLEGSYTTLAELADLIYAAITPASVWATWQRVADGLYFEGTPEKIRVRTIAEVQQDRAQREAKRRAEQEWTELIQRLEAHRIEDGDRPRLVEVERLALLAGEHSRILQHFNILETPENAHRFLVRCGYWEEYHNPHPRRFKAPEGAPDFPLPALPDEPRRDLTHLRAFAIDDHGNQDPDDAIGLEGDRLWVHVADVAALVAPDSELDREARARGANLYLPETLIPMLPMKMTERLGLGLQTQTPALSIGLRLGNDGIPTDIEVCASWVRVERITYESAETELDRPPLKDLHEYLRRFREARQRQGATSIDLPEVVVRVRDGAVSVRPLTRLASRELVTDAMLLAGTAIARWALAANLAIPFVTQPAPDAFSPPGDLAGMFAARRLMRPSRLSLDPAPHFSLGLALYTRVTSPLRRYSDLLVHQQLRAHLSGRPPLTANELAQRMDVAELAAVTVRRAERLSNLHWKLVYLKQHPNWEGDGVVVEKDGQKVTLLVPGLALETRLRLKTDPALNEVVRLSFREADLPDGLSHFRVRGGA